MGTFEVSGRLIVVKSSFISISSNEWISSLYFLFVVPMISPSTNISSTLEFVIFVAKDEVVDPP